MIQIEFAKRVVADCIQDDQIVGIAAGGSWITDAIDEFSDLDLVVVTRNKITGDKENMLAFASRSGELLSGFTGEHVGEPRLLICLFDNPLLHVDFKFVTIEEFKSRVETPVILLDKENQLKNALKHSSPEFPYPDYQWIEDRFWIWVHYILQKIGRGEYMEALDSLGFLRMVVFGPLLHVKNGNLPRGVRKVEMELEKHDLRQLVSTIPLYDRQSLLDKLRAAVSLYTHLREELYDREVKLQEHTRTRVMQYFEQMEV
ncbi:MAG: aminoglycoside 6-adenylyltransferase [Saprospiraceae bacterium]|nr:aminoglycoside 6-adenylyltransferase [Saprospiraceae bacterium]